MFKVRVEVSFAAAHFLSGYHGKCENLHGHNYRARLWVRREALGEGGMVADFAALRQILKEAAAPLDHTNLNDIPAFENNPSAERIAAYLCTEAAKRFPDAGLSPDMIAAVDVFESPGSLARYIPE
ncbi:MAG: 6-carboxytetrahydropterin synthase QueD [Treponematales bacterium]